MSKEGAKGEAIAAPEANVKPLDYKEQFSVRAMAISLSTRAHASFPDLTGPARQLQVHRVRVLHTLVARCNLNADVCMCCSPCADASKASMDCLNRNDYDRDACLAYFQAYRDCKSTWVSSGVRVFTVVPRLTPAQINQRKEDRRAGRPTS